MLKISVSQAAKLEAKKLLDAPKIQEVKVEQKWMKKGLVITHGLFEYVQIPDHVVITERYFYYSA